MKILSKRARAKQSSPLFALLSPICQEIGRSLRHALTLEPNDAIARDRAADIADILCKRFKEERLICDYCVVCDDTNNSPMRVENNELILDIFLRPTKIITDVKVRFEL